MSQTITDTEFYWWVWQFEAQAHSTIIREYVRATSRRSGPDMFTPATHAPDVSQKKRETTT